MKTRHLITITIMLAILTIGVASATDDAGTLTCENMTENPIQSQAADVALDLQDEQNLQDPPGEIEMEVTDVPENVNYSKYVSCHVSIPDQNANGNLYVYVDEMPEYAYGYSVSGRINAVFQSANYVSDFGNHSLYVKYVDSAGRYANTTRNFTFATDDYELSLSDNYGDAVYGKDYTIGITAPFDARGTMIITHNGVDYVIPPEAYYWLITIPAANLQYGRNEVKIRFIPQEGCKLMEKTVTDSFNCSAKIMGPDNPVQIYGEVESVVLILPKDSNDNLIVRSGGHIWRVSKMSNGRAAISLKDLSCGRYTLEASYIGKDYSAEKVTFDFEVVPKVVVSRFAYRGNETFPVVVTLPTTTSGTLTVQNSFNSEQKTYQSANGTIIVNMTTPNTDTQINVRYTQGDFTFEDSYHVSARNTNPEFEMNVTVDDVIKGRDLCANIKIPEGYGIYSEEPFDGYFVLFIDGVEVVKSQNPWIFYSTGALDVGTHDWRVEFADDSYYHAEAKSGTFDVGYFACQFDENVTLGSASVFVKTASDARGIVILSIDGVECDSQIVTDYVTVLKLPDNLTISEHEFEVSYVGNYPEISQTGKVNVGYDFSLSLDSQGVYAYGQPVTLTVKTHSRATGNVSLEIADGNYTLELKNGTVQITLTDLECAEYTAVARYAGDSSFCAKTANATFRVEGYAVLGPKQNIFYGDDEYVNLTLPEDADGNLTVKLDGVTYGSVKLESGKAAISLKDASPGIHSINAYYDGGDYSVSPYDVALFNVAIRVIYPNEVNAGEDAWIYMLIPKDAAGKVIMNLSGEIIELVHNGGIINESFRLSKFGEYPFTLTYNATDYDIALPEVTVCAKPGNFTCPSAVAGNDSEISFTVPSDGKGKVSIYNYGALLFEQNVTGPNVTVSLAGLKPGRYNIAVVYEDEKYGNFTRSGIYLTVSNPVPSISISNSGNDKHAVFTFNLPKDATGDLIVKIDASSHYIKVKNGIATLSLDNLAAGKHEVSAQYLGGDNYSPAKAEKTVDVASSIPARIVARDASLIYSAGGKYSVTVYAQGGALAKGVQVIFKVNGKKVASVKTNSKGVATYKVVQKPGTYRITVQTLGKTVTKKLTVKHILKLKKAKVKRSAKKLVIKATLAKVNGKYLKNKKITLKFKGKKYKAKTNKKGVAKFTIKSKVLKKLKKGKKVTYQATYLKDSVKCTVKVKK